MRFKLLTGLILILACAITAAQGPPPFSPEQPELMSAGGGTPPIAPVTRVQQMKSLVKNQVSRAIGKNYPNLGEWKPLTAREKFDVFLHSTYSPRTFANAAIDEAADRAKGRQNREYETGLLGAGQRYGINLATTETDVFFQRFLFPTLLKQDPRYFRNPDLPFLKRALYSMTRVLITRTDSGGQTFNSSRILSIAATRAVNDLYVPGERQGMHPIGACVSFTLLRDAGLNLVHEFWPDLRRKFLHR
jgi:hypothetical protein